MGVLLLAAACAGAVSSGQQRAPVPDPALTDFRERVDAYMRLHRQLSAGLPPEAASVEGDANGVSGDALAARIRAARADATQGSVITPPVATLFRQRLNPVLRGAHAADARAVIRDDAPQKFALHVNDGYPSGAPLPTVPGDVLAVLPVLPDGLEYRIVDRHLILRDVRANIIVDYLFDVMCATC